MIQRRPEVRRDLFGIAEHISNDSLDAAIRFLDAAESTFSFLECNREVGQTCSFADPRLEGLRVWRIDGFSNHLVYFRAIPQGIEVLRVLHGARDIDALFGE